MKGKLIIILTLSFIFIATNASEKDWYEFSPDGQVCHIYNRNLPTPWFNRLTNGYLTAWVTHKGGIEVFLSDPSINGLVNPQEVSGNFYVTRAGSDKITWVNNPENEDQWECRVGLGYSTISCTKDNIKTEVTYFIPLDDNVLLMSIEMTNLSASDQDVNIYVQVEWNLGDAVKYIVQRGDGRAGSQQNLYKKTWFTDNTIWAVHPNWRNVGACRAWPYTGYLSSNFPVESYETIRSKFLGYEFDFSHPQAVKIGELSNTDFWSEDDYPWGVLHTKISLKPDETKEFTYILGMERDEESATRILKKYAEQNMVNEEFARLQDHYNDLIEHSININTPDIDNDRIINIWSKYHWNQVIKRSQNDDALGVGLWCYGIEGGGMSVHPEHIMLPNDKDILYQEINYMLRNQTEDVSKTSIYTSQTAMLYEDLQMDSRPGFPANHFDVPHHHNIWGFLTSLLFYMKEYGDKDFIDKEIAFFEGSSGDIWEHIDKAIIISLSGLSPNGLPLIPANVGDWMDEFTKISQNGNAESVMLGMQLCFYLKEFAKIAELAGQGELQKKWEKHYESLKNAINETAWDGNWYIRAFSDRNGKRTPVGTHMNNEGKIYLNAQSWSVLGGVASGDRASKALHSVGSMMISDFGPMIFYPPYSSFNEYVGTQSLYSPGFRNGCIYLRPTSWAIMAACLAGESDLAWEMYNKASLVNQTRDIERFQCEPYVYPENYVGPDHRLAGKGQFQWCLGEATSWMWVAYNYYLLGIRPEYDGLLIDPKMPEDWDHFSVERPFRGDHYSIDIMKIEKLSPGKIKIYLDGKPIKGNLIRPVGDGEQHKVRVEIGQ
ncbi:MAG: hypothetical protein ISS19_07445 [Bacteroidales bacterium]|nr:hypothetical protein [Bacteroidales bacterium]